MVYFRKYRAVDLVSQTEERKIEKEIARKRRKRVRGSILQEDLASFWNVQPCGFTNIAKCDEFSQSWRENKKPVYVYQRASDGIPSLGKAEALVYLAN